MIKHGATQMNAERISKRCAKPSPPIELMKQEKGESIINYSSATKNDSLAQFATRTDHSRVISEIYQDLFDPSSNGKKDTEASSLPVPYAVREHIVATHNYSVSRALDILKGRDTAVRCMTRTILHIDTRLNHPDDLTNNNALNFEAADSKIHANDNICRRNEQHDAMATMSAALQFALQPKSDTSQRDNLSVPFTEVFLKQQFNAYLNHSLNNTTTSKRSRSNATPPLSPATSRLVARRTAARSPLKTSSASTSVDPQLHPAPQIIRPVMDEATLNSLRHYMEGKDRRKGDRPDIYRILSRASSPPLT